MTLKIDRENYRGPPRASFFDGTARPQMANDLTDVPVQKLTAMAQAGDVSAQFFLSEAYRLGRGVDHDDGVAFKWCAMSAQAGCADAQNNLGVMYQHGIGVEQSVDSAADWYAKASEQRLAVAKLNLGTCHFGGKGRPKDLGRAAQLFREAIFLGCSDPSAIENLGLIALVGEQGRPDLARAAHYFVWAAEEGLDRCLLDLKTCWEALIVQAMVGDKAAILDLIRLCCRGWVLEKDLAAALAWAEWGARDLPAGEWNVDEEACMWAVQDLQSLVTEKEQELAAAKLKVLTKLYANQKGGVAG